jgi:hypothetical protein
MTVAYRRLTRLGWLLLAFVALINGGCLLALAGAAGAGAAAGYVYYNGLLYRDYHANMADTLSAVRTALVELQFPILEQKADTGTGYIKTRTADGHTVRIYMDLVASPIPIEGAMTRVGVRVGYSGDELVSARILDQVSRHLVPPGMVPGNGSPSSGVQLEAPRPIGLETAPPPLAPVSTAPTRSASPPPPIKR